MLLSTFSFSFSLESFVLTQIKETFRYHSATFSCSVELREAVTLSNFRRFFVPQTGTFREFSISRNAKMTGERSALSHSAAKPTSTVSLRSYMYSYEAW